MIEDSDANCKRRVDEAMDIANAANHTAWRSVASAEKAKATAENAEGNTKRANDTAEEAKATAVNAEGIAKEAKATAVNAEGIAKEAKATAVNAEGIAKEAKATAVNAEGIAKEVNATAVNAKGIAKDANRTADTALTIAASAIALATSAERAATVMLPVIRPENGSVIMTPFPFDSWRDQMEVFHFDSGHYAYSVTEAVAQEAVWKASGSTWRIATAGQVYAAAQLGAQWCRGGWTRSDANSSEFFWTFPRQQNAVPLACGFSGPRAFSTNTDGSGAFSTNTDGSVRAGISVYGVKPTKGSMPICANSPGVDCVSPWVTFSTTYGSGSWSSTTPYSVYSP